MGRRLVLLRHGETEYNATARMQGQLDTKLSERGVIQARQAARYLSGLNFVRVVCSDLQRAHDTAREVATLLDVPLITDERLRETHLGEWQGKTHAEIDAATPGARARWRHDVSWAPPGGETRLEVAARARAVVDEAMAEVEEWEDKSILCVAHGGTINALTGSLLGFATAEEFSRLSTVSNTCWAQLQARPHYDPSSPQPQSFTADNLDNAQWYLEGWNVGVTPGLTVCESTHP
ncbi:histidine phosphatase family protein [Corynebacterium sp. TAE3-ERU2]|uniref:histidine phosphatase family protein n=1 Tax=Corynebacterium sp. TAE3-ERU2 TaxID=2849497 RepID=UPI001C440334|nr:histidine phosphatase family protein [Corynebacterium sp. TAE3-ERU2]MBV7301447.1 histidine phosphatase family protein [Corynebacterium sp. TAE3-ERU2]